MTETLNWGLVLVILILLAGCDPAGRDNREADEAVSVDLFFIKVTDQKEKVVPTTRAIRPASSREEGAVRALIDGVSEAEQTEGYTSSIPPGTDILSFRLENGLATVDFTDDIEPGGGSAWVTAIRNQITRTLLAFDSISKVEIRVEGKSENVLQP